VKVDDSEEKSGLFTSEWVEDAHAEKDSGDNSEAERLHDEKHAPIYQVKVERVRLKAPKCPRVWQFHYRLALWRKPGGK
jgi:hypothetical protein